MKIFKKDTTGKIRTLEVFNEWNELIQISGLINWKKVKNSKLCFAKNSWKKNSTTDEEQAKKQAEAVIVSKLKEWYFKTIKEAEEETVILPMLAKDYKKEKKKIDWASMVRVQPKLDWMRCLAFINNWKVKLMSRAWREIETTPHIIKELEENFEWKTVILDWELYCHWIDFQENMKLIKKFRPWESEKIKYHVYDVVSDKSFSERQREVLSYWVHALKTIQICSEDDLKSYHTSFIEEWYEWTIIRHWDVPYKVNWRSSNLLKYKDFIDETFTIIDVVPSSARPEQWVIVLDWFKANLKMSHANREEILTNKKEYIWKTAEIRYFETSQDWIPRFPVCVWIRLDK